MKYVKGLLRDLLASEPDEPRYLAKQEPDPKRELAMEPEPNPNTSYSP